MKIICTKEEYTEIVRKCALSVKESDCQCCIFRDSCGWDYDYLPSLCDIVSESEEDS